MRKNIRFFLSDIIMNTAFKVAILLIPHKCQLHELLRQMAQRYKKRDVPGNELHMIEITYKLKKRYKEKVPFN